MNELDPMPSNAKVQVVCGGMPNLFATIKQTSKHHDFSSQNISRPGHSQTNKDSSVTSLQKNGKKSGPSDPCESDKKKRKKKNKSKPNKKVKFDESITALVQTITN